MSGEEHPVEWYLARDDQQFGPLSDVELKKFIELGHMRGTDLLWRHGFPDWRPASSVFPSVRGSAPASGGGHQPQAQSHPQPEPQPQPQQHAPRQAPLGDPNLAVA